ncbi:gamma-glutamyltransferase [Noviherbaspirillum cavernae]|uniref:Glutathione hydrolase proenzyme n=1 Tax=Noviherbaspirillum cavernae TaxID=2320862 RepID=A0A418X5A3_9BURK|nr:gamma-glutamyltransferase [Noviherbaspirillum cavernae]RJG07652.1 gamma-glutamyltransferase [Noviherbaspirillum cavernae]
MTRRIKSYASAFIVPAVLAFGFIAPPAWADRSEESFREHDSERYAPHHARKDHHQHHGNDKATHKGVVAVSHPLAAQAGAQMLEAGGNAIDAAAAIQFALNVVEPQFSGIGGGGFMMIYLAKTNQTFIIDSREKAPAAATPDMFLGQTFAAASTSGHSVGVPGTVLGVATALKRWGRMNLAETLEPAIMLAEKGFRINRFLAANINDPRTALQPETKAVFRLPDGSPLPEGYLLKQPDLAKTFKLIAGRGPEVFYTGEIAQAIVEAQKRSTMGSAGVGRMILSDLAAYDVKIRQPVTGTYRGVTVKSMSPPSSGGLTVIQMLKMLEQFPIGNEKSGFGFGATKTLHVMTEAMRLGFADRAVWMGDEDFVPVPKRGLISNCYVDTRKVLINPNARMASALPGNPLPCDTAYLKPKTKLALAPLEEEKGVHTTHFSVVDKQGNVVAYTTTIENTWGTGIIVPGYGFLLNNELTDFNFTPQFNAATGNPGANDVAPFKRPRSSMSPTMLFKHGEPFAAYGSPGGATIINSVLNITLNLVDHGMSIQQAIDAPRLSVTSAAGAISCEPGMTPAIPATSLLGLQALGHLVPLVNGVPTCSSTIGSVQGVVIDLKTGKQYGGADQRREGTVISLPQK